MTACTYSFTRPTTYTVRYVCACGWASDELPSDQMAAIGAQLVRHAREDRTR